MFGIGRSGADAVHKLPLLLEILRRYHTLPWERTDVRFGSTHLPSPFAHEQIVGKLLRGAFEDPTARDVLEYMADRFVVDADGRRMGESQPERPAPPSPPPRT